MKYQSRQFLFRSAGVCGLLAACLALTSCGGTGSDGSGGGQSAGIGGTGIVYGKITGFGSIFVNGGEYNTDDSSFTVDGNTAATQDDLSLGMVVRLEVEIQNGKITDKATQVEYDDEVQGPIETTPVIVAGSGGTRKTFDIFGTTVIVDQIGTLFKGTGLGFDTLATNDVIEVSGFRSSPSEIIATFVEKKGVLTAGSEVELRGIVTAYSPSTMQFMLDGLTIPIAFDGATELDVPNGVIENGMFVEVKGSYQTGPVRVDAEQIEREDDNFANNVDDASLQGIISEFSTIDDEFKIDGLRVDASGAEFEPANAADLLGNGVEVEVEGKIVGGVLIADQLELRSGESKIEARVQAGSVDSTAGQFEAYFQNLGGTVVVRTDTQTLFEDEAGSNPLENMTINDLGADDFVRIEGREINGELVASVVKRDDYQSEFVLEGAVDDFSTLNWIEILGIRFNVDGLTQYEEGGLNATQFFSQLAASGTGTLVKIKDDAAVYGVADEVEFED